MDVGAILAFVQAGEVLVTAGAASYQQIRAFIASVHPGLSDADLNAILDGISAGAQRHKALADADAGLT